MGMCVHVVYLCECPFVCVREKGEEKEKERMNE